jgi:Flp pilus assembly protein CpaB
MVSPRDAERIALAQSEGEIMLVLRNPLDQEPTMTSGVRTESLLGTDETPAPAPKPAVVRRPAPPVPAAVVAEAPPAPKTVEAIRAAKRSEEVIR